MRERVVQTAKQEKHVAQAVMEFGDFAVQGDCLADEIERHVILAALRCNGAEQMKALRVIAMGRWNSAKVVLRFGHLAGLELPESQGEKIIDYHGHYLRRRCHNHYTV